MIFGIIKFGDMGTKKEVGAKAVAISKPKKEKVVKDDNLEVKGDVVTLNNKEHYAVKVGEGVVYLPMDKIAIDGDKAIVPRWLHELKFGK